MKEETTEDMRGGEKEEDQERRCPEWREKGGRNRDGAGEAEGEWGEEGSHLEPVGKEGKGGERLFYYLHYLY